MASVNEVNDPYISLAGVFPVQAARVLLQRTFPRNRHGQHQGIQRRMIETFPDELPGGQQDAWRLRRQRIKFCNDGNPLLLRDPTVQYEGRLL